jgi:hypothetical protein
MVDVVDLQVGQKTLQVCRPHLKKWLQLEQIRSENTDRIEGIYTYLSVFLGIKDSEIDGLPWMETLTLYQKSIEINKPELKLPYLKHPDRKLNDDPWNYPQRLWYSFAHLLASAYRWSIDQIAEMDVDDALAMVQEILIDTTLKREWEYSLTTLAYYPDHQGGTSRFHPLPRPAWMMVEQKVRKIRIPKDALPVGNVQGFSKEFEDAILAASK